MPNCNLLGGEIQSPHGTLGQIENADEGFLFDPDAITPN